MFYTYLTDIIIEYETVPIEVKVGTAQEFNMEENVGYGIHHTFTSPQQPQNYIYETVAK